MTTEHEIHCENCYNVRQCLKEKSLRKDRPDELISCAVIRCRLNCSHEFHECKQDEHELLCPNKIVHCINFGYGCPMKMARKGRTKHLTTCPASVVVCTVEWNRKPLPPWQVQPFIFDPDHLDVAAVVRDERTVVEFKENLPSSLRSLLQTNNRKQPIMPLGVAGHRIPNSILIQNKLEKDAMEGVSDADDDDDDFSFSETPGGSKKSPPGLQESVCNKLKELSFATAPDFRVPTPTLDSQRTPIGHELIHSNSTKSDLSMNGIDTNKSDELPIDPGSRNGNDKPVGKKKSDALSLIVDVTSKGACKYMNLYTFMCAREFRRDEYAGHFKSIHTEVLTQLNGWLFTRCPLANYGCDFGVKRMFPANSVHDDGHHVVYNEDVGSFCFTQIPNSHHDTDSESNELNRSLCDLPFELLVHLTKYLDPLSLNALSMTNTLLRSVCQLVVVDRGIVVFDWQANSETGKWEVAGKKWIFSTAFTPMRVWKFGDVGVVANHMKVCPRFDELRHRPDRPFSYPVSKDQL